MGIEYSDAIDYFVDQSRVFTGQNSHSAIVLHGTGGPETWAAQQLGDYFRTTPALTSSHFGIDRAGIICQYVSLNDGAAANCCLEAGHDPFWDQFGGDNLNIHTISIEHVNDATNSLPLTDAQKQASFKLVAWLCNTYGLTADQIKTHASIDPINRAECPGPAFPLDELKAYLNGGNMFTYGPNSGDYAHYFTANHPDGTWICKLFNTTLLGGNLRLFQTLSLDGQTLPVIGLPRTNELYQTDESDGYKWSVQFFERGLIVYDPGHAKDSAPGQGDSYLGKPLQFQKYDPQATTVEVVSDALKVDIKSLPALATQTMTLWHTAIAKLLQDAGLPTG